MSMPSPVTPTIIERTFEEYDGCRSVADAPVSR
jgi:hypothetical protein